MRKVEGSCGGKKEAADEMPKTLSRIVNASAHRSAAPFRVPFG